jgi:hypothetical protein
MAGKIHQAKKLKYKRNEHFCIYKVNIQRKKLSGHLTAYTSVRCNELNSFHQIHCGSLFQWRYYHLSCSWRKHVWVAFNSEKHYTWIVICWRINHTYSILMTMGIRLILQKYVYICNDKNIRGIMDLPPKYVLILKLSEW